MSVCGEGEMQRVLAEDQSARLHLSAGALALDEMVLRYGAFGRGLGSGEVLRVGPS